MPDLDFLSMVIAIQEGNSWTVGFGGIDDTARVYKCVANSVNEINQFIDDLASETEVREDPTATSGLRRHLMRSLGKRACQQAIDFKVIK